MYNKEEINSEYISFFKQVFKSWVFKDDINKILLIIFILLFFKITKIRLKN